MSLSDCFCCVKSFVMQQHMLTTLQLQAFLDNLFAVRTLIKQGDRALHVSGARLFPFQYRHTQCTAMHTRVKDNVRNRSTAGYIRGVCRANAGVRKRTPQAAVLGGCTSICCTCSCSVPAKLVLCSRCHKCRP